MSKKEIADIVEGAHKIAQRMVVYDDELEKNVEISYEMQQEAWQEYTNLQQSVLAVAVSLSRIREKKYYLAYGFNNFAGFYQSLGYSKDKANRMRRIGEMVDGKVAHVQLLDGIDQLKLVELTRLSKEMQDILFAGGEIIAPNGQPLDLKTIREMPREDFIDALHEKSKENLARLKADKAIQRDEIAALKKEVNNLRELLKGMENLKLKYEPIENSRDAKDKCLNMASRALEEFVTLMNKVKLDGHDPDDIIEKFAGIVGSFDMKYENNYPRWMVAIQDLKGGDI